MNKFVKGAKNLAFALSFVTVAACGGVKDADLKALEEKINNKLDGKADNGQGYALKNDIKDCVRKSEIGDFVKSEDLDNKIEDFKKETVSLDVLKKAFVKNPVGFVKNFGGDVVLPEASFSGYKIVLSGFASAGKCKFEVKKDGDILVKAKQNADVLTREDLDVLKICVLNGADVSWDDKMVFAKETSESVKFNDVTFDLSDEKQMISLSVLLEIGLMVGKKFENLGFNTWVVNASSGAKIGGKGLPARESNKMFVDVLNKYKQGCCEYVESDKRVKFKGNMGWTTDGGSAVVASDVVIAVS